MRHIAATLVCVALLSGCTQATRYELDARAVPVPAGGRSLGSSAFHENGWPETADQNAGFSGYAYPASTELGALTGAARDAAVNAGWNVSSSGVHPADLPVNGSFPQIGSVLATRNGLLLSEWIAHTGSPRAASANASLPIELHIAISAVH